MPPLEQELPLTCPGPPYRRNICSYISSTLIKSLMKSHRKGLIQYINTCSGVTIRGIHFPFVDFIPRVQCCRYVGASYVSIAGSPLTELFYQNDENFLPNADTASVSLPACSAAPPGRIFENMLSPSGPACPAAVPPGIAIGFWPIFIPAAGPGAGACGPLTGGGVGFAAVLELSTGSTFGGTVDGTLDCKVCCVCFTACCGGGCCCGCCC